MKNFTFLTALLLLCSCAQYEHTVTNTTSNGILKNGVNVGTMELTFSYYSGTKRLSLMGVSSTGEKFAGNMLQVKEQLFKPGHTDVHEGGLLGGVSIHSVPPHYRTVPTSFWHVQFVGNKGTVMVCDFNSYSVSWSPVDDGEGGCQASDGTTIPIAIVGTPLVTDLRVE